MSDLMLLGMGGVRKKGGAATTISGHATLPTSLVSYWKLDESSGNAADSSGNGNTLTNNNTTPFVAGKINNGADLEAGSNQSFSITDAAQTGLDITGDLSFSWWMNVESKPAGWSYGIIDKRSGTIGQYTILFRENASTTSVSLIFRDASNNETDANFNSLTVNTGTWYHCVATMDVSEGVAGLVFYINAVSQTRTNDSNAATSIGNNTGAFFLGDASAIGTVPFDGVIDEAGIWSKALTSTEVSDLYNSGNPLPYN